MITIKKYPNRRLYDTSKSHYINLETVKAMVKERTPFQVLDSKSGSDISQQILLQIVNEHETQEQYAILSRDLLEELIRQYGASGQMDMRASLDHGLREFLKLLPVDGDRVVAELLSEACAGADDAPKEVASVIPLDAAAGDRLS